MKEKNITASESMLVRSENLDQLLLLAGEVIVASSNLELVQRNLQVDYGKQQPTSRDVVNTVNDLTASTSEISSNLHRLVQDIRTVSLQDMAFRTRRLVRDVTRRSDKHVQFVVEGQETVVDKSVVEQLFDPISHQLRNAIDHGMETMEERRKAGKSEEGQLLLRMYNTEHETVIEIKDDGRGVDMQALHAKALKMGLVPKDGSFGPAEALVVMCHPGISTVENVTEVSGRGVGMDVVREKLSELGGNVSFETQSGKGSSFTFRVPLVSAVNIVDAMVVEVGCTRFAFPIKMVQSTMSIEPSAIESTLEKGFMIHHQHHLIPLYCLQQIFDGIPSKRTEEKINIVVIEHQNQLLAFEITDFCSPQKLVIIPMDSALDVELFAGATILGGRRLGFVINTAALFDLALGRKAVQMKARSEMAPDRIQNVDESAKPEPSSSIESEDLAAPVESSREEATQEHHEFLLENKRLILNLNETIFAIENDPQNRDRINEAFRLFHTVKGNFVMVGLPKGASTVHAVESVLDAARNEDINLEPATVDLFMDGISYIENAVRGSLDGTWEDQTEDRLVKSCAAIIPRVAPEEHVLTDTEAMEVHLSHEAAYRINMHRKQQCPLYQADLVFESASESPFLLACLIYRRFCEVGDVLGTAPSLASIEKGIVGRHLKIKFASDRDSEHLNQRLSELLKTHYGVREFHLSRME